MPKYFWIKERDNLQLGTYFVAYGQISVKEAREKERSLYGFNYMHKFATNKEYEARIAELRAQGCEVIYA